MSDAKHTFTPGPWHRIPESPRRGTEFSVYAEEVLIAETISAANARLIAAAPEMLRVIEDLVGELHYAPRDIRESQPADEARALLGRVRGEETT